MPRQLWWVKQLRRCGFGLSATTFARLAGLYLPAIQYDMQTCLAQHRFKSAMKSWTIYKLYKYSPARTETTWNILEHYLVTEALFRNGDVCRQTCSLGVFAQFLQQFQPVNFDEGWQHDYLSTNPKGNPNGKEQYCKTWVPARNSSYVLLCLHQRFFANKSRSAVGSHCGRMKAKHIRKRTAYDSPMAIYLANIYIYIDL